MKLVTLSRVSLAICAVGAAALLAVAVGAADRLATQHRAVSQILELKDETDRLSVASDRLLLSPPPRQRWQRYVKRSEALERRLRQRSDDSAAARAASEQVKRIRSLLAETLTPSDTQAGDTDASANPSGALPSSDPSEARAVMGEVARYGSTLDSHMGELLRARRSAIERNIAWLTGALAATALLFAAACAVLLVRLHHRVARPLETLASTIERIRRGESEPRLGWSRGDELGELANAFDKLLGEQRAVQADLLENERMLAASQRRAALGTWRRHIPPDRLQWSHEIYRIVGVEPDSFQPTDVAFAAYVHPDDRSRRVAHEREAIFEAHPYDIRFRIVRADGAIRHVHEHAEVEYDDAGEPLYLTGTIQDITTWHAAEQRLEQYQAVVEGSDDLVSVKDDAYRYVLVNNAYADFHGRAVADLEGAHVADIFGAEHFERVVRPYLERCLAGEQVVADVTRTDHAGRERTLLARYYPLDSSRDGQRFVASVITDITELRDTRAALEEQARLLEIAGEVARLGGWSMDAARQGPVHLTPTAAALHGKPPDYAPTPDEAAACYVDGDQDRIKALVAGCTEAGQNFDEELQFVDAQGQRRWMRVAGEPARDTDGAITGAHGALQDVTKQKRLEAQLRESLDQLDRLLRTRQELINALPANIALLAEDGTVEEVNESWRSFGAANEQADPAYGVGDNYLDVCARASGSWSEEAAPVHKGLSALLAGERQRLSLEYPCHSPTEFRWYRLEANRLPEVAQSDSGTRAVVMHFDVTERKLAEAELERLAHEDALTRLGTRRGFILRLQDLLRESGSQPAASLVALDLSGLRDINDTYGYDTGDQLLVELAGRLETHAGDGGIVGRIGGDEFTVFLPAPVDCDSTSTRDRFAQAFETPICVGAAEIEINARFGYTVLGETEHKADELLREAELALFRNRDADTAARWTAYTAELDASTQQRIETTRELQRAIELSEFELHFQPKVDLTTGRLIAGEALLRWQHPERGLQSPGLFIPIAERSQLIVPIGAWAIHEACRCVHEWRGAGLDIVPVAVNVSLVQFTFGDFHASVREALETYDVPAWALSLEITESVFEEASDALYQQLEAIHALGVRLSLDDFGTGYSSLLYLQQYPFDEIKIDQAFVRRMRFDSYSRQVVQLVIDLAHSLDVEVVAEGIEDWPERDALLGLSCRLGQGYYYSMPLETEDFRWLLAIGSNLPLAGVPSAGSS
jgi:diguanylate cyclase (GGDEF)-like protein/PAS domain S-box-containing protein